MTNASFKTSRRDFLKMAGAGAAALTFGPFANVARGNVSPNEKLNIALVGIGWQGAFHLSTLLSRIASKGDIELAAVCDVYTERYEKALKKINDQLGPNRCEGYQDFRRILDRKDIDAVIYATPDHWHALQAIMTCQAGKDAYIEKPMTTSIVEGRRVVEAARRYGRIVQVGIQQRSMEVFKRAMEVVHSGTLGRVTKSRAWIGPNGGQWIEHPTNIPKGLDWDLWLGPAPWSPFSNERFGGFRAFRDYTAGGELANWGVHLIDIALWGMQQDRPLSVAALGGSYDMPRGDDYRQLEVLFEFEDCSMTWSQTVPHVQYGGKFLGTLFEGERGMLVVDRENYIVDPAALDPGYKSQGDFFIQLNGHHDNFFNCIRTRQLPHADCEIGHRATAMCLLGSIASDLGRKLTWNGETERFVNDEAANRHLMRPYRAPWAI